MIRALLRSRIRAFERRFHYDASYLRDLLEVAPSLVIKFGMVSSLGHRRDAPAAAMAAAGMVGTVTEDCGPCTQICVDLATQDGVAPEVLRAILAGDEAHMGDDAGLAYRFARASLLRSLDADPLRDEIVRRWGKRGLVALALALTTARMYPTLKYALGHGHSCARIAIGGQIASVNPRLLSAAST